MQLLLDVGAPVSFLAIRKYSSGLNYYWNLLLDDDSLYVGGQYVSTLPMEAFVSPRNNFLLRIGISSLD